MDHGTVKVCSRKQEVGVKMGSPRPSFRCAKNYDSQGRFEYGRLGATVGPK